MAEAVPLGAPFPLLRTPMLRRFPDPVFLTSARRRVVVALAAGLGFYSLSDILLWQRIFEAHNLAFFDPEYQTGHVTILVGIIAVGAVLLLDAGWLALWFGGALYTMAFGGAADVLYYWLDGRAIPGVLPWLDRSSLIFIRPLGGDVTNADVLASTAFWIGLWAVALFLLPRAIRQRSSSDRT